MYVQVVTLWPFTNFFQIDGKCYNGSECSFSVLYNINWWLSFLNHFYLLFLISLILYIYSFLKFNLQSSLSKLMSSIVSIFFPIQKISKFHLQILSSSLALDSLLVSTWKGLYTVQLACIYLKLFLLFILIFFISCCYYWPLAFFSDERIIRK